VGRGVKDLLNREDLFWIKAKGKKGKGNLREEKKKQDRMLTGKDAAVGDERLREKKGRR